MNLFHRWIWSSAGNASGTTHGLHALVVWAWVSQKRPVVHLSSSTRFLRASRSHSLSRPPSDWDKVKYYYVMYVLYIII